MKEQHTREFSDFEGDTFRVRRDNNGTYVLQMKDSSGSFKAVPVVMVAQSLLSIVYSLAHD